MYARMYARMYACMHATKVLYDYKVTLNVSNDVQHVCCILFS